MFTLHARLAGAGLGPHRQQAAFRMRHDRDHSLLVRAQLDLGRLAGHHLDFVANAPEDRPVGAGWDTFDGDLRLIRLHRGYAEVEFAPRPKVRQVGTEWD